MKRAGKSKKRVCKKQWMKREEEDEREFPKWMTHYCSDHQILLVGDGDFSFSLSLAKAFGSADNIVATSLDTNAEVTKKYKNAKSNLEELQKLGAYLLHGVDATKMKFHPDLKMRRFDRIIFNFPHAGFYGKEDNSMMIKMHMDLVFGFFKNATHMLRINGEVHVNHKTTPPFDTWNIEKLAEQSFLMMIECADFKQEDYPGYNNKRGHRSRCDDPFPLGKCSTFKFVYNPRSMKDLLRRNHVEVSRQQEIQNMERFPAAVYLNYHPQTGFVQKPNQLDYYPQTSHFPKTDQLDHDPQTSHFPKADQRNHHPQRVASSADHYRYARDTTHDTQRLLYPPMESSYNQFSQLWQIPTNCRLGLTEHHRRTMDVRMDGYRQYQQVFERSSAYLEEELNRNAERPGNCYDIARHELERYNAEVCRRNLCYAMSM
ncbi:heavy metal-associated isoprenylated plant protein 41-like [Vicia villosa]|uniref:heavy metal-associated isoprenylated plant protein 41-like n=1 Tax=Vicia villosa TaxID=3911 RepID=UPI00273B8008|nr:heavy metal-associated isoprenylated plant protein 41-like [Vicia villosa]